jgi:predicted O-linked N-acetylglucosamine transferase (SPINDLY family)
MASDLLAQAKECLLQGNYAEAAILYERAIDAAPDVKSSYWYLGLVLLLQGQAAEAQTTWLMAMMDGEPSQVERWTEELQEVLRQEADRREALNEEGVALAIRQQIGEICPEDLDNALRLMKLATEQEEYTGNELIDLGVLDRLRLEQPLEIDSKRLLSVVESVLNYTTIYDTSVELARACVPHLKREDEIAAFIDIIRAAAAKIANAQKQPTIAAQLAECGLRLAPNHRLLRQQLASFYQNAGEYEQGIEMAKSAYAFAQTLPDKIYANYLIIRGLLNAGGTHWQDACSLARHQESLLQSLLSKPPAQLTPAQVLGLQNAYYFAPYIQDEPRAYRKLWNQITQFCQVHAHPSDRAIAERYKAGHRQRRGGETPGKPLKLGYTSSCFRNHSVGWLARWLLQHHDRDRFDVKLYFVACEPIYSPLHDWYVQQFPNSYNSNNYRDIAERIYQDEIDILIDLDSITFDVSCQIVSLKPAPIQVTWLGWDASGIPTIDYFIADPYVLPESAQEYYSEKIWRLPQAYIAVDGFEVGVPTLRRDELGIPDDAIVYFSAQRGFKRHPDTARLQMKIVKEVPNSYFLIKGFGDDEAIEAFFTQLAEAEGVAPERLRFLPGVWQEAAHRANLSIADVVLDTYPYNGATTTLETLWMGIPLVTRVGEQFAARNSYTMMLNAGITEGIARTDEEYVEWGVRLGKEEALRQQVTWKLRQSKRTAPLWNSKQFTGEMEKAYEQMWARYLKGNG